MRRHAQVARRTRTFVRQLITSLLRSDGADRRTGNGEMIELLCEIQLNGALPLTDRMAVACLKRTSGTGGKTATCVKKLLLLQSA